jgi:hypothetical protein
MWLRENYNDTCEQLRNEMRRNSSKWPSCYDAGQFVMYPLAPIFTSHCHQLLPKLFYQPHYFIWLLHLFHRIPCPSCKEAGCKKDGGPVFLRVKGWPHMPRRVFDIECVVYTPPRVLTDSTESVPTPWTPYPLRPHSVPTPCPTMEWVRSPWSG